MDDNRLTSKVESFKSKKNDKNSDITVKPE